MTYVVSTPPASEPVLASAFRSSDLNILDSTTETYLDGLVAVVRDWIERAFAMAIVTQTITEEVDELCDWNSILPLTVYPVASISSIKYYDTDNNQQTLADSNYQLVKGKTWAEIHYVQDADIPSVYDRPDAVEIIYIAGNSTANVPPAILQQIKTCVSRIYYDKEDIEGAMRDLGFLMPYIRKHG